MLNTGKGAERIVIRVSAVLMALGVALMLLNAAGIISFPDRNGDQVEVPPS